MGKIITDKTFGEIENLYLEALDNKMSFEEIKLRIGEYEDDIPAFIKYLYAKYHYINKEYSLASVEITDAIRTLSMDFITTIIIAKAIKDIYGLAGEIYACNDEGKRSLDAFKSSMLYSTQIKSIENQNIFLSFRNYNQFTLSDLINGELTLCSPKVMNDPYDTLFLKWGEFQNKNKGKIKKHIKYLCNAFDYYRIRSFSLPKDNDGNEMIENILMWSHYAGNHEGFCVKYKLSENTFNVTEKNRVIRLKKVIYSDKEDEENALQIPVINLEKDSINTDLGLCRKHPLWKYENEVRLIAYFPENESFFCQIPLGESKIESIYFGYKCPKEHIKTIMNLFPEKGNISFYKMESDYSNIYRLKAKEI